MNKRTADEIEEICRQLGTYDYDDVYDKVHPKLQGDTPYTSELRQLIMRFSEAMGTKLKPVGQGAVLRCREFTVFRYVGERAVYDGVDINAQREPRVSRPEEKAPGKDERENGGGQ